MRQIFFVLLLSLFPLHVLFADEAHFECRNNLFLKGIVILSQTSETTWNLDECMLEVSGQKHDWTILEPVQNKESRCFFRNISNKSLDRRLFNLHLSKKVLSGDRGWVRISLDNSQATFGGSKKIMSFISCRPL